MKHPLELLRRAALTLTLAAGTLTAAAQHDHGHGAPATIPGQPPINASILNRALNEPQRIQYRDALAAQNEKVRAFQARIVTARKELLDLQLAEKFDEAAYRAKAGEILKAQSEIEVLNALAFSKVRPSLTPEQLDRLRNAPTKDRPHGGPEARPGVFPMGAPSVPQPHRPLTNRSQIVVPPAPQP